MALRYGGWPELRSASLAVVFRDLLPAASDGHVSERGIAGEAQCRAVRVVIA
jgi:hypothetical protein